MANHNGLKNHICVLVCELIPCAVNVCMECHEILIVKNRKMIRKTWNLGWCNVMLPRWCGKEIGMFDECLDTHPSQTGATHYKVRGSERKQCMFDDEREIASSYGLQIFSTFNMHYYNCNVKFWKILGVIWPFKDI